MKLIPHADDFFSQKDAEFFYQREFRRVYAHAALVLAVWDEYTQLADTRECNDVGLAKGFVLLRGDKPKGCKQHSSGKLKFPSSQTDAHPASASHPTLSYRVGLESPRILRET